MARELIDRIPGKQTDRKTPLGESGWLCARRRCDVQYARQLATASLPSGELNWIFTAITDTIAWNVLPRALFQRLFRQVPARRGRAAAGRCAAALASL